MADLNRQAAYWYNTIIRRTTRKCAYVDSNVDPTWHSLADNILDHPVIRMGIGQQKKRLLTN